MNNDKQKGYYQSQDENQKPIYQIGGIKMNEEYQRVLQNELDNSDLQENCRYFHNGTEITFDEYQQHMTNIQEYLCDYEARQVRRGMNRNFYIDYTITHNELT